MSRTTQILETHMNGSRIRWMEDVLDEKSSTFVPDQETAKGEVVVLLQDLGNGGPDQIKDSDRG
ncbi:hypothetical protein BH18GEM1_BH18GEM1_21500 [soil metagenome]